MRSKWQQFVESPRNQNVTLNFVLGTDLVSARSDLQPKKASRQIEGQRSVPF